MEPFEIKIEALSKETWKGVPIPLVTRSDSYYDLEYCGRSDLRLLPRCLRRVNAMLPEELKSLLQLSCGLV